MDICLGSTGAHQGEAAVQEIGILKSISYDRNIIQVRLMAFAPARCHCTFLLVVSPLAKEGLCDDARPVARLSFRTTYA
jgi:hypothetical protein